jgi:hypothetical protein
MLQERYFQQGRFPNIQGPFFISSKTGKGIGKLHHELMKVALLQPHMQVLLGGGGGSWWWWLVVAGGPMATRALKLFSRLHPPRHSHACAR